MNKVVITLDIDWAPDFIVDRVASLLRANRVRATWFVTHQSPAIDRLREDAELFELGIHPNFLPGSTQGTTPKEVLDHLLSIIPDAVSIRCHAVVHSGPLLELMLTQTPVQVDSTLFLPYMSHIQPVEYQQFGRTLLRIPFFWADDYEMGKMVPDWDVRPHLKVEGLKVFLFHPIHVYLNSTNARGYADFKKHIPRLNDLTPEKAESYVQPGAGTQTAFKQLIQYLTCNERASRLKDIFTLWKTDLSPSRA